MVARSYWRGCSIYCDDVSNEYRYADDDSAVKGQDRPCGLCKRPSTESGHDPCIANLPNVVNACCGHGRLSEAYVHFKDGRHEQGESAIRCFIEIGKNSPSEPPKPWMVTDG